MGGYLSPNYGFRTYPTDIRTINDSSTPTPTPEIIEDKVVFYDFDGTERYRYTKEEFLQLEELPAVPIHTGLIPTYGSAALKGWNWSLDNIKEQLRQVGGPVEVSCNYRTESGKTEVTIVIPPNFKEKIQVNLWSSSEYRSHIIWGDGEEEDIASQYSNYYFIYASHQYPISNTEQTYIIEIGDPDVYDYTYQLGASNQNNTSINSFKMVPFLTGESDLYKFYNNQYPYQSGPYSTYRQLSNYNNFIKKIRLSNKVSAIRCMALQNCIAVEECSFPFQLQSLGFQAIQMPHSFISLPRAVVFQEHSNNPTVNYIIANKVVVGDLIESPLPNIRTMELTRTIPYLITSLNGSFNSEKWLQEIVIPGTITTLSNSAFNSCYNLEKITINDLIERIGSSAFNGCYTLKKIYIPNSVKNIENNAFSSCYSLDTVIFEEPEEGELENLILGSNVFSNDYSLKYVFLPKNLKNIPSSCFYENRALSSIELPSTLEVINSSAFQNCYSLDHLHLPNILKSIGSNAFYYCYSLSDINLPNTLETLGSSAFAYCYNLQEMSLPNSITSLGNSVFQSCINLKEITLPNNINNIPQSFLNGCNSLLEVNIPDSVEIINSNAFSSCSSLKEIKFPSNLQTIYSGAFSGCSGLSHIIIPDNVTLSGSSFFSNCTNLKYVKLPSNLTVIPNSCFSSCQSIESIDLPSSVITIENSAFNSCNNLKEIDLSNIRSIGSSAFNNCWKLENIILPTNSNFISLESSVFSNCYNIKTITIPNQVTTINSYAFQYCSSLENIILSNNLQTIGYGAFQRCQYGLKDIIFPNSITSIGDYAFSDCYSLKDLDFSAFTSVPTIGGTNTFYRTGSLSLWVRDDMVNTFKSATNWSYYSNYIKPISDYYVREINAGNKTINDVPEMRLVISGVNKTLRQIVEEKLSN